MFTLRRFKYFVLFAAAVLITAVFLPWATISSVGLTLTGMNTEGTDFGKPGYFHLFMTVIFIVFTFLPKIWAKRMNLLVSALNLAWAIRNFIIIPACMLGECPQKEIGIWLVLGSSIVLLLGAMFPDAEVK